jgi:hypothetical protein
MLTRHAVLLTQSLSLRLSQPPCYQQNEQSNFHSPCTLPSSVSRKSFSCNTYKKQGVPPSSQISFSIFLVACSLRLPRPGRGVQPRGNSPLATRHSPLSSRHWTQVLSFHTLARSFAPTKNSTLLFSSNSALFAKNHPGWGYPIFLILQLAIRSARMTVVPSAPGWVPTRSKIPTPSGLRSGREFQSFLFDVQFQPWISCQESPLPAACRSFWHERPSGVSWGLRIQRAGRCRSFRAAAPRPGLPRDSRRDSQGAHLAKGAGGQGSPVRKIKSGE